MKAIRKKIVSDTRNSAEPSLTAAEHVQRVNVDFGHSTLAELDQIATNLNVSRQAVIKLFIQRELDQHFLARRARIESNS